MSTRKRYALIGTGGRSKMYLDAIAGQYKEHAELVGLCDISQSRMDWHNQQLQQSYGLAPCPTYQADHFGTMIAETKPDIVIVTSIDYTHHLYIIQAMEMGCDVITEKPMTVDAEKGRAIFDVIERTGRHLRVAFNYRYVPLSTQVRDLLMRGTIGRPLHVDFQWALDTYHGADYFRRWHREKDKSGGLLVHKATHHFDLINWWLASYPEQVFAFGDLAFYGRENAAARGESYSYDRYTGNPEARHDPFAFFLDEDPKLKGLYLDAEQDSGYIRDRNVFGDNITVEDTMSVTARYRNRVILTYSLVAYSPWEGYRCIITGTKGCLDVSLVEKVGRTFVAGEEESLEQMEEAQRRFSDKHLRIFPMFGIPYEVEVQEATGGHGGGDRVMLDQIFLPDPPQDPYHRDASHIDGAASILMGIAADVAIATGQPVCVDDLLQLPKVEFK
ncbi:MAG: Gfo/Idh/MocA family oxidoreductase [Caldilineaceae bacterium]|nr:Gfo/Idh/MocA family oxidoreductase [Caldilineaceae bacterium]